VEEELALVALEVRRGDGGRVVDAPLVEETQEPTEVVPRMRKVESA
jgi:hypothetical protein